MIDLFFVVLQGIFFFIMDGIAIIAENNLIMINGLFIALHVILIYAVIAVDSTKTKNQIKM
jgi:hypothetical protein